ncbi:MAG: 50S ribosomal protein L3 [Bacteriovoracaceae bacterium]|jgi:large subunit ribosomal protein L3|nr:50S ribosomal protein L3 [Halobacteriovoraceae bacterium]MDP7321756.1 50S ribosomal protein L3 [Bacteriovoracaceae bacterium]|tara:strand:- start:326 stop:976 length:651 start_codon:yes stop_codon:yes gene_type:complete
MSENTVALPAIYAQKAGMTRIFDESGKHIPVTVIKLIPNIISQVKTKDTDGYDAYQVAYYEKREKLVNKPLKGHLKKAGEDKAFCRFAEVKSSEVNAENLGKTISTDTFAAKTMVDVTGTSKGKGFAGVIKRYGFSGGPGSHGHTFHRGTGSVGQCDKPGRIFAQKKMPGHMGVDKKTVQNLEVVELNVEQGYMLIRGSVPGAKNGFVKIAKALKK